MNKVILDLETDAIRTSVLEMNLYLKKVLSSIFFSVCVLHSVLPTFQVVFLCMKLAIDWRFHSRRKQ